MTHGSKSKRQHGSIGSSATPSRVLPGLKMAGQMGNKRVTIKGLQVGHSISAQCNVPAFWVTGLHYTCMRGRGIIQDE